MLPSGRINLFSAALQSVNANEHLCHLIGETLAAKVFAAVGLFSQRVSSYFDKSFSLCFNFRTFAHIHPEFVDKLIACNIPHPRLVPASTY